MVQEANELDEAWPAGLWQTFFTTSVGVHIPLIPEGSLSAYGYRKFQLDVVGNHHIFCTSHWGVKKDHDWVVDQMTDLFHTTHKVKTQQVSKSRGQ